MATCSLKKIPLVEMAVRLQLTEFVRQSFYYSSSSLQRFSFLSTREQATPFATREDVDAYSGFTMTLKYDIKRFMFSISDSTSRRALGLAPL